jgi:hypothetical protein
MEVTKWLKPSEGFLAVYTWPCTFTKLLNYQTCRL